MTVDEFKKLNPKLKNLKGCELYDAMEDYMLRQQSGDEILKTIMTIWKTHTLRWLFYRKLPNMIFNNHPWSHSKRCNKCKKGFNMHIMIMGEDSYILCPKCGQRCEQETNTNITYKIYNVWLFLCKLFWKLLDKIHLIRSSQMGRYDMFGDEARYVKSWIMNFETGKTDYILKQRKWWEYLLIEKHIHHF